MELSEIQKEILRGKGIEEIVSRFNWKEFEEICSKILEKNDWNVKRNYRFKFNGSWYEIDILVSKNKKFLAIDCKQWGIRKGKTSQLRIAARKQIERVNQLKKLFKSSLLSLKQNLEIYPLIITWFEEEILKEENVWIVPIFKLNSFLLEIDKYL